MKQHKVDLTACEIELSDLDEKSTLDVQIANLTF